MRSKRLSVKSRSEYSSTHFSESSSNEKEGLLLESDDSGNVLRYALHHFPKVIKQ